MILRQQRTVASHIVNFTHLGTLVYSAPEKLLPSLVNDCPKEIYFSPGSDVWSLGCILVEVLLGTTPFFANLSLHGIDSKGK